MSITLAEPKGPISDWKPTRYMESLSRHLEDHPEGLSFRVWRDAIDGARDYKEQAINELVKGGHVAMEKKGNAHIHTSVTPYREPARDEPPATT